MARSAANALRKSNGCLSCTGGPQTWLAPMQITASAFSNVRVFASPASRVTRSAGPRRLARRAPWSIAARSSSSGSPCVGCELGTAARVGGCATTAVPKVAHVVNVSADDQVVNRLTKRLPDGVPTPLDDLMRQAHQRLVSILDDRLLAAGWETSALRTSACSPPSTREARG
jgi:hypothetical protein